jgi:hypothetical protein
MTELGEDQYVLPDHGDGVELAYLGASPTVDTSLQVHLGDHLPYCSTLLDGGIEEKSRIGLLHIAVHEQWTRWIIG